MRIPLRTRTCCFVVFVCGLATGFVTGWWSSRRVVIPADAEVQQRYVREKGSAPAALRAEVLRALQEFQDGYTRSDPQQLDVFMQRLFPRDQDVRMIGTNAGEWCSGYDSIARLVRDDWTGWGDVRLAVDDAVVSGHGDAAWLATPGRISFRTSSRSIRFTATLTRQDGRWLFRQVHFQYDERFLAFSELFRPGAWLQLKFR